MTTRNRLLKSASGLISIDANDISADNILAANDVHIGGISTADHFTDLEEKFDSISTDYYDKIESDNRFAPISHELLMSMTIVILPKRKAMFDSLSSQLKQCRFQALLVCQRCPRHILNEVVT